MALILRSGPVTAVLAFGSPAASRAHPDLPFECAGVCCVLSCPLLPPMSTLGATVPLALPSGAEDCAVCVCGVLEVLLIANARLDLNCAAHVHSTLCTLLRRPRSASFSVLRSPEDSAAHSTHIAQRSNPHTPLARISDRREHRVCLSASSTHSPSHSSL